MPAPALQDRRTTLRRRIALSACVLASLLASLVVASSAQGAPLNAKKPPYVFGINTYLTYNCQTPAQIYKWATTEVQQYKALHANAIAIAFPLYTASLTSNSVIAQESCTNHTEQSPPASIVGDVIKVAHRAGFSVLLRPLIDQENLFSQSSTAWRGVLKPNNVSAWFHSYLDTLYPYLQIAQSDRVEHFAIQSELDSLADKPNWVTAITKCHSVYGGNLVFDWSWDTGVEKISRAGTTLALDTYPKVTSPVTATVAQLTAQWSHLLNTRAYKVPRLSRATIDEIGIPAQDGAYQYPFKGVLKPMSAHPFNQQIQVHWFSAACAFMKQHRMKGIYFWGPWLTSTNGQMLTAPDASKPSDIQPLAKSAVRRCFS